MGRRKKRKLTFKKLFLIFVIGCIIGVLWEESYLYIKRLILDYDDTSWRLHRGLIYGPFNPVYGLGAFFITLIFANSKLSFWKKVLLISLIGGIVEYSFSFFQELFFDATSWNYDDKFLNIHGRTNVIYMLFFGFIGALFVVYLYPPLSKIIDNMKPFLKNILFYPLFIFFILNAFISFAALDRQNERYNGIEAENKLDKFCDEHYPDEFLKKYFVNMKRVD